MAYFVLCLLLQFKTGYKKGPSGFLLETGPPRGRQQGDCTVEDPGEGSRRGREMLVALSVSSQDFRGGGRGFPLSICRDARPSAERGKAVGSAEFSGGAAAVEGDVSSVLGCLSLRPLLLVEMCGQLDTRTWSYTAGLHNRS